MPCRSRWREETVAWLQGRPIIPLLKSMCLRDAIQERHRQCNDVLLPKPVEVFRARQCAVEQPVITQKVPLARRLYFKPIMLDYGFDGQHLGSFGKGSSDLRISREMFAA